MSCYVVLSKHRFCWGGRK